MLSKISYCETGIFRKPPRIPSIKNNPGTTPSLFSDIEATLKTLILLIGFSTLVFLLFDHLLPTSTSTPEAPSNALVPYEKYAYCGADLVLGTAGTALTGSVLPIAFSLLECVKGAQASSTLLSNLKPTLGSTEDTGLAVDGHASTIWRTNGLGWAQVDLGALSELSNIQFDSTNQFRYGVQISNDTISWQPLIATHVALKNTHVIYPLTGSPIGRFLKLSGQDDCCDIGISELQVYGRSTNQSLPPIPKIVSRHKPVVGMTGDFPKLVDGVGTIWTGDGLSWFNVDLGAEYNLTRAEVRGHDQFRYGIQTSLDSVNWVNAVDTFVTSSTDGSGLFQHPFDPFRVARFVKLFGQDKCCDLSISRFDIYAMGDARSTIIPLPILVSQGRPVISSVSGGSKIVDGSDSTTWIGGGRSSFYIDLGSKYHVAKAILRAQSNFRYGIEISNTSTTGWATALNTFVTGRAGLYEHVFPSELIGRYVRVTGQDSSCSLTISDMKIFASGDSLDVKLSAPSLSTPSFARSLEEDTFSADLIRFIVVLVIIIELCAGVIACIRSRREPIDDSPSSATDTQSHDREARPREITPREVSGGLSSRDLANIRANLERERLRAQQTQRTQEAKEEADRARAEAEAQQAQEAKEEADRARAEAEAQQAQEAKEEADRARAEAEAQQAQKAKEEADRARAEAEAQQAQEAKEEADRARAEIRHARTELERERLRAKQAQEAADRAKAEARRARTELERERLRAKQAQEAAAHSRAAASTDHDDLRSKIPFAGKNPRNLAHAYEILGCRPENTLAEIESSYRRKATQYHPDRVARLGEEFQRLATDASQKLNQSMETIRANRR